MASLQERNGSYRILFCHHGKLHTFTIGKVEKVEAENKARQVDYLLMRLKQRLLVLPEDTDVVTFIEHDGKPPDSGPTLADAPRQAVTIGHLKDRYLTTHGNGTIEANSLDTCKLHLGHFVRALGEGFPLGELSLAKMQEYVNHRAKTKISPVTIRKEIATLRAAWNWGEPMGLTEGKFPNRGLRYPKADEKPPFMTMAEIERQLAGGGDPDTLWEALYLQACEMTELLVHVKDKASHPWIYPLFCFAGHTGARRSELLRALVADVDFIGNTVLVREKKRTRGQRSTRRVPMTPFLKQVLHEWLAVHPGGPALFCHAGTVARSKKRSRTTGHQNEMKRPSSLKGRMATVKKREQAAQAALTRNEVHDHFKRVLAETKWERMRGLHTLRHSFISACASKGVDQRLVQEWAGHMNEATSKRYRHLYPSTQQEAIKLVF
ncbi:MAG TPA: site-specific integrase, partial [Gemmataceae bacterium]|nr:site-specific integrase [Gemmataceae bacterium]